ncbi:hypothetical protein THAOC_28133 [Thalassiosira oceanica]|uniref:Uncharacterized protein n=1 Tax=Thalassiosira oceanica TaxID=159749 RepID=K0RJY5_THAOC|nr:hypothetical protein THAOC_28133 [Thalassiosira oceanica]|eukprot:EJK52574.1 hypothetical protein THAOC_28133 [Thalassiosira oceanica]
MMNSPKKQQREELKRKESEAEEAKRSMDQDDKSHLDENQGSLKNEETRLENFRAGQLVALASLVPFQSTLQHRFSEHNLKRETRTWQKDKPETP